MKQIKLCRVLLLIAMSLPLLVSCGGDDDEPSNGNNNSFKVVDGVHVNARKLLYLDVYKQGYSDYYQKEYRTDKIRFTMSYDSKGRLVKICAPFERYSGEVVSMMNIDYDLKFVEYCNSIDLHYVSSTKSFDYLPTYLRCFFTLNGKGFISRFGDCELSYNDEGYLVGANTEKNIWTFAYNDGDISKYLVEKLKSGNIEIFYANYSEKEGDLYFAVNDPDGSNGIEGLNYNNYRAISVLIAYHAGLFGNISKHCINLPNSSSNNAIIEQFSDVDNGNRIYHCSFVFD